VGYAAVFGADVGFVAGGSSAALFRHDLDVGWSGVGCPGGIQGTGLVDIDTAGPGTKGPFAGVVLVAVVGAGCAAEVCVEGSGRYDV